jgi:hypothetical protein
MMIARSSLLRRNYSTAVLILLTFLLSSVIFHSVTLSGADKGIRGKEGEDIVDNFSSYVSDLFWTFFLINFSYSCSIWLHCVKNILLAFIKILFIQI